MKDTRNIILIILFTQFSLFSQRYMLEFQNEESTELFEKGEKAYAKKRYEKSVKIYGDLIAKEGEDPKLIYNQLTSLIHTLDTVAIEKSFENLIEKGFLDCNYLASNEDFKSIRYRIKFELWQKAVERCSESENQFIEEHNIGNPDLRKQLLWMKMKDVVSDVKVIQKIRYGAANDLTYDELKEERAKIYENNFTQLLAFTLKNGWPGESLVGEDGSEAAWLIAQHGNHLPPAQEHLLGLIEKSVAEKETKMIHYAHLYDRVKANFGKPQKYGTLRWRNPETGQWELYPLENEEMVNEYRKEAGLPEISEN